MTPNHNNLIRKVGIIFISSLIFFALLIYVNSKIRAKEINKPSPTPTLIPTPDPTPSPTPSTSPTPKPTISPTPKPKSTPTPLPSVKPYSATDMDRWFHDASSQYNVTEGLLKKIAICESFLRPLARNGPYAGLFQFTESAWRSTRLLMGLDPNTQLRYDPEEAIKTAAYKISKQGPGAWPTCSK